MKLLLATRNRKKLEEMRRILANDEVVGLDDVPAYDEVPESGLTFEANALIKAR
jgi:XTP/dITP diphosphohydrolase